MKAFTYHSPTSEQAAVTLLGAGAVPLAGGSSLLNLLKERVLEPERVVNLKAIAGLARIEPAGEGLRIGANVTLAALLESAEVRRAYPALVQAAQTVGTPQIRNVATVGGNLCAPPACWYYVHEGFPCPRKGAAEACPAKTGENEYHAIFATDGPCVAVHASSLAPALVALGARVRIAGPGGAREVEIEKFFRLPKAGLPAVALAKAEEHRENVLAADEIVTHVALGPARPRSATYVVLHKESHDWPVGLASASLEMQGDTVRAARVCLGAVAPVPWRAAGAEAALAGRRVTAEVAAQAAEAAVAGAAPLAQNAYKVGIARAAVRRAILLAATGKWM
jgi:xanthine dehydrogenase YagS FAD-binding subunit